MTRMVPFLLESDEDGFVSRVFWTPIAAGAAPAQRASGESDAGAAAGPDGAAEGAEERKGDAAPAVAAAVAAGETLGRRLVHAVFRMLFLPNFTVTGAAAEFASLQNSTGSDPVSDALRAGLAAELQELGQDPERELLRHAVTSLPKQALVW